MEESEMAKLREIDSSGDVNAPESKTLATRVFDGFFASHQCYWNDRLYIAIKFNLDKGRQRQAVANSVVANGSSRYFESKTHYGFDNRGLLEGQGVPPELIPFPKEGVLYERLPRSVIEIMARKFEIDLGNREELRELQKGSPLEGFRG